MAERVERSTVDLSGYPDLVVIYLGMRVRKWKGLKTIFGFGPKISNSVARRPPGLLLHETYFIRGGFEAIYDDVGKPLGFMRFAPVRPAKGAMFSARHRLGLPGTESLSPAISEADLDGPRA